MNYRAGDISLVRFPRADLEKGKCRPVLLLAKMPGHFNDGLVCAITSQLRQKVRGWDEPPPCAALGPRSGDTWDCRPGRSPL